MQDQQLAILSVPPLPRLWPPTPDHAAQSGKFQQSLGCLAGACLGSHLYPILVHLVRPGQALLLLNLSLEFIMPAENSAAPLPKDTVTPPPGDLLGPGQAA